MATNTSAEATVSDFTVGERVQHVFHGSYGTVVKLGRALLHVEVSLYPYSYDGERFHTTGRTTWRPTSVRKVS